MKDNIWIFILGFWTSICLPGLDLKWLDDFWFDLFYQFDFFEWCLVGNKIKTIKIIISKYNAYASLIWHIDPPTKYYQHHDYRICISIGCFDGMDRIYCVARICFKKRVWRRACAREREREREVQIVYFFKVCVYYLCTYTYICICTCIYIYITYLWVKYISTNILCV